MAEQILSQMEVDALLRGLSNGDIKTEAERLADEDYRDVKPYDFSSQDRVLRGKLPALEMINEKFVRSLRNSLFNVLRRSVDVAAEGTRTMKYEEFLRNLQVPSSLNVFQLHPFRGHGLLAIDPALVFIIVDSYFGGDGRFHTRIEGRDFTNVEQAVVKKVVDVIFDEMKEVWKAVHPVEFRLTKSEMNPQFVNMISNTENVIISAFRMEIESVSNNFFFCLPYTTIEPIRDKLMGTHRIDSSEIDVKWTENLRDQFGGVSMNITAEMGGAEISVHELMGLKAGDIIQLDRKARDLLEVSIEGVPKLLGRPGVMDNHYALKLTDLIRERG
ncbi:MAG: flagellar motor switch protein FliM [Deltaproteobacteria bacterium]|nr:flagellar motor switch protein FliM [Deltaproteobacteria bacterium]